MSRISFIHTNIDRVNFRNINWKGGTYDGTLLLLKYLNKERKKFIEKGLEKLKEEVKEIKELEKKLQYKDKRMKIQKKPFKIILIKKKKRLMNLRIRLL